jgi:hypothetical protein
VRRAGSLFLAALIAAGPAFAGKEGTFSGESLLIGLGARPLAMGNTYIAVSDDLSGAQYNPAGIGAVRQYGLDLHYSDLYEGLTYGGATVGIPAPKSTTLALSYFQLDSGSIPKTIATNRGLFLEDAGSFDVKDTLFSASVGSSLYQPVEFGLTVKHLSESIDGDKGSGTLLDFGGILNIGERIRVGAVAQNVGGSIAYPDKKERVPKVYGAGAAARLLSNKALTLAADLRKVDGHDNALTTGAEYMFMQRRRTNTDDPRRDVQATYEDFPFMALRAGYMPQQGKDLGAGAAFSFGIGFIFGFLRMDYAFVDAGDLGLTHRGTVGVTFGHRLSAQEKEDYDLRPTNGDDVESKRHVAPAADRTKGGRFKLR